MYEYKVVSEGIGKPPLEEQLNELAAEGWRVVAGAGGGSGYSPITLVLVLERKKSP